MKKRINGRIDRRYGSWLKRTLLEEQRKLTANKIRGHRKKFLAFSTYPKNRDFQSIINEESFDIKKAVGSMLKRKGRLFVLDSGAGYLGVSSDLKKYFGSKVFVTALNPISPVLLQPKKRAMNLIKNSGEIPFRRKKELIEAQYNELKEVERRSKEINEYKVGVIENFSSKKYYDIIVDFMGPLRYSDFTKRVLYKYFTLLKPEGAVFTKVFAEDVLKIKKIISDYYGRGGNIPKKARCYFRIRRIPGTGIHEIKKIPLKTG
ncbi:MAG: hypothetical protein AB1467_00265 [Candidatus Diapherotrites archaeon]